MKPLVYAGTPRGFVFGSEIQALFALDPSLSRDPDLRGIDHYLTFQYIPAPMSGFAAIRKLPPAHAMVVRNARVERVFRYWDLDLDEAQHALVRGSLRGAARAGARGDQAAPGVRRAARGFPLRGIDSSITVAAMAKLGASPLRTYSIGFEDERFNELPHAREIATHLGTEHHEMTVKADAVAIMPMMIDHLGEPLADNSVMPTYYVSQFARSGVTVALTGDGGDEVFAGYRRFYQIRRLEWLAQRGLLPVWRGLRRMSRWRWKISARPAEAPPQLPVDARRPDARARAASRATSTCSRSTPIPRRRACSRPSCVRASARARPPSTSRRISSVPGEDVLNRYLYLDLTSPTFPRTSCSRSTSPAWRTRSSAARPSSTTS